MNAEERAELHLAEEMFTLFLAILFAIAASITIWISQDNRCKATEICQEAKVRGYKIFNCKRYVGE